MTTPAIAIALVVASVLNWPDRSGFIDLQRQFENLIPQMAICGILLALALILCDRTRLALILIVLNFAGLGQVGWQMWQNAAPLVPDKSPDLTVLWFNMFNDNPLPATALRDALIESPADVVLLAEAAPLRDLLDDPLLAKAFPVQLGCRATRCELLVLARDSSAQIAFRKLYPPRSERIARVEIKNNDDKTLLTVVGMQLFKPWYFGPANHDDWFAVNEIGRVRGPLLLMGDFNAAPWSHRVAGTLQRLCGVKGQIWPPATWPIWAGQLGLPLDQAMTRDGVDLVRLTRWGHGLGSNHAGLLAQVAIAPEPTASTARETCHVPLDDTGRPSRQDNK